MVQASNTCFFNTEKHEQQRKYTTPTNMFKQRNRNTNYTETTARKPNILQTALNTIALKQYNKLTIIQIHNK